MVLTAGLQIDEPATMWARAAMPPRRAEFSHGPGRVTFEAVWSLDRYDALHRILEQVPVTWRYFIKHRIFAALKQPGTAADVYEAYDAVTTQFAQLPRVSPEMARAGAAE